MLLQYTCTDEVAYTAFLPLEEVTTLATAEVQYSVVWLDVGPQQHTRDPVVEVTHVEDWALEKKRCR